MGDTGVATRKEPVGPIGAIENLGVLPRDAWWRGEHVRELGLTGKGGWALWFLGLGSESKFCSGWPGADDSFVGLWELPFPM